MLIYLVLFAIFLIFYVKFFIRYFRYKDDVLVITYETDLNNKNLISLKKSLKKNNYRTKVITEKKWNGFGGKIRKINKCLKYLHPEQIVVISDARDVLSVNYDQKHLLSKLKKFNDIETKVIFGTEIGCCVRAPYEPGKLRSRSGKVLHRTFDKTGKDYSSEWKKVFQTRAKLKNIEHGEPSKPNIYINAGLYIGKVKNILSIYKLINIDNKEDDQLLMSEIYYHYPNKFHLDYNRDFISNSHVWDSYNKKDYKDDSGCYYKLDNKKIKDTYLNTYPYFIHTPGKHFKCYDSVNKMIE